MNWGGEVMANPAVVAPVIGQLVAWTGEGRLDASPDRVYSFEQAGEAFAAIFERRSVGTVVITP